MTGGDEFDDINAALAKAFGDPEVAAIVDKDKRRKREKRMAISPTDGRRKRATGRTIQFNCKIKPEIKARITQASRKHDLSITVMLERAMLAYLERLERGGRDA